MTEAPNTPETSEPEIRLERRGHLGHLILNRPKAINALTANMVSLIGEALDAWEHDDGVATVLLSGAGERGLCAGGDIVALYRDAGNGGRESADFWAEEYELNARISSYPKPYVALMDGIVLGGGVGVSAHARHRVVTERTKVGMPETGIGFVPDIGGTYLLSRAPGELGTHAALTAGTMTGADALLLGLADVYVDSSRLGELSAELEHRQADEVLQDFAQEAPEPSLAAAREWIDECFAYDDVETIIDALLRSESGDANAAAAVVLTKSPSALKVTLQSLRRARDLPDLRSVLEQEYRVSLHALTAPDFAEGVRAQVIDKDRSPQWMPATLAEVRQGDVDSYFAPLDGRPDLWEHRKAHGTNDTVTSNDKAIRNDNAISSDELISQEQR
ncbi:enoyl-CoA hydratase/isomerase family protein [Arthrobacter sunyaminii]|uniref:3-hydroxyisobutyryl-CoA hydrolase n=1 Tax=Arthrobacter sunyaminii TaxID=2816859 RepID=A0A975PBY5_9MICC|nr:enoyl-CoA hydratase/isomerase family protein [Arthrobacter sunyaminii]MBO0907306.1 enoyl-CoA hydratase/isomerase family protein [Arthrobacter sunyaminii]QWQ34906.1 enoyl-CoA hydratase/isomerase family protein [Arthrobacter sunyaminii]